MWYHYVAAFMPLHQEKKESEDYGLLAVGGGLREEPVGCLDKRHERNSEDENQLRIHQSF